MGRPSRCNYDNAKLTQLKLALGERLTILKKLDDEILNLTQDTTELADIIKEADALTKMFYETLARLETFLMRSTSFTRSSSPMVAGECYSSEAAKAESCNLFRLLG